MVAVNSLLLDLRGGSLLGLLNAPLGLLNTLLGLLNGLLGLLNTLPTLPTYVTVADITSPAATAVFNLRLLLIPAG